MRMGIKRRECLDPSQGRKKQRLEAPPQRLFPVMQQGKVLVGMGTPMGLNGLLELDDDCAKDIVLVEPVGKEMHAHIRQPGRGLDDLRTQGNRPTAWRLARAPLGPMELPLSPPPVEMADTHGNGSLPLGDLVEEDAARARWVLLEHGPQQSLLDFTKLAPSTKGWT